MLARQFVVSAPGYAITHIYRSPFPRSSSLVNLRPERLPEADRAAPAVALMTRPRGYLDPKRDRMSFDGQSPPPGALPGAGVSTSRLRPVGAARPIVAEINGERVVGRRSPDTGARTAGMPWMGEVSVLELTY